MHISRLPVTLHADLPAPQRLAFRAWVRAVYLLVEHLDTCPFACTAEQQRCLDGMDAVDAEQEQWQQWRKTREEQPC